MKRSRSMSSIRNKSDIDKLVREGDLIKYKKLVRDAKKNWTGAKELVRDAKLSLTAVKKWASVAGAKKSSRSNQCQEKPLFCANGNKVPFDVKEENAKGSNGLQSSSTGSESAGTKTIFMPIKQEANGQSAEAIIVDNKQKAEADFQDVKLVEAEKKD